MSKYIRKVSGDKEFVNYLNTKNTAFRLVASYTETCEIKNISSAGLPGKLHLTPPADMEMLLLGKSLCMPSIPEAPAGPPSPVIISYAVKNLFNIPVYFVDAGLKIKPAVPMFNCDVKYSGNILEGANVDVDKLLLKGFEYADGIETSDLEIVAECVPGGTTTAYSLCKSFGYKCDNMFSASSTDKNHNKLKKQIVDNAINRFGLHNNPKLFCKFYGDNMQPFTAALASKLSLKTRVVLSGGTQMLAVYALIKKLKLKANFDNIAVITTKWVVDDENSDFEGLAKLIDENMNAFCCEFAMNSRIKNLALYETGMVKEGVGAGALISYALANGITPKKLLNEIERIYGNLYN